MNLSYTGSYHPTYLKQRPFSVACCLVPPLETLPPRKSEWGSSLPPDFFCLQRKHLAMWVLLNICFHGEALLAPRPNPKLEDHTSSAVRDCLFNLFAATLHIGTSKKCLPPYHTTGLQFLNIKLQYFLSYYTNGLQYLKVKLNAYCYTTPLATKPRKTFC